MQRVNILNSLIRTNPSSQLRLVFLYRYVSLLLTSFLYLIGPQSPFIFKVGVVLSLGIAAWILTDLQKRYMGNSTILKMIVLTETIGLTLLLIPTGGISSPFIWYALNPVLVAASFLKSLFCWGALVFYLSSATLIAYHVVQFESVTMILEENSYFYLVCILTTLLAQLYSGLTEELTQVNKKLTETNQKYQETLDHVMSLYHLMDSFASEKEPKRLTEEITSSLIKCTKSDAAFFWVTDLDHNYSHLENSTNITNLENGLKDEWDNIRGKKEAFTININNDLFWMKIIRTSGNIGVLGVKLDSYGDRKTFLMDRSLDFLADLSEIMLERTHLSQMKDQMLVVEEQNRIANEIHDSVSQRLFGMAFALHSLKVKSQNITKEELNKEYEFLSQSIHTTTKELQSAIYRLSSVKKGEEPFFVSLRKFLDEYAKLNDVRVDYQISGDESLISVEQKQAIYRIVSESCGNAVRHGKCKDIKLNLSLRDEKTVLVIRDNGVGINSRYIEMKDEKGIGIGIVNMKNIVSSFAGSISIDGKPGLGTEIQVEIPNNKMLGKQEVAG